MKLYKTSYFKEITELEVISFNKKTFDVQASIYRPNNKYFIENDRILTCERYGSQNNYHETLDEAKEFVSKRLNEMILKTENDLKRYKEILPNFL